MSKIADTLNMRLLLFALGFFLVAPWCADSLQAQRSEEVLRTKETESQSKATGNNPGNVEGTKMLDKYGIDDSGDKPKAQPSQTPAPTPKPTPSPVAVAPVKPKEDKPAFLGVHYELSRTDIMGSYVTEVEPNTPAAAVGLRLGDVITKAEGQPLDELEDLVRIISTKHVGDKVTLTINRSGRIFTVAPVLAERTRELVTYQYGSSDGYVPLPNGGTLWITERADAGRPFLGLTFRREERIYSINGEEVVKVPTTKELVVTEVTPGSTANIMGLQKGDVLTGINGRSITDFNVIPEVLQRLNVGDEVRISYLRSGRAITVAGKLRPHPSAQRSSMGMNNSAKPQVGGGPSNGNAFTIERLADGNKSSAVPVKRVAILESTVQEDEVQALRKVSGYDFPSTSSLRVTDFRISQLGLAGQFMVRFTLPSKGDTFIYVLDNSGNIVYSESMIGYSGTYHKNFNLPENELGDYFVQISQSGQSFTRKISLE